MRPLAILAVLASLSTSAFAQVDNGGDIKIYALMVQNLQSRGVRLRLGGTCLSACTMKLAIAKCVEPDAMFGFHSAKHQPDRTYSESGSKVMASFYTPALRRLYWAHLYRGGRMPDGSMLYLSGRDLAGFGYTPCQ